MNYKFKNPKLLLFDGEKFYIDEKDLYVKGNRIYKIGQLDNNDDNESFEEIDAKDKLIMPGLINMHGHTYMTIFRNYADDVSFSEWLFEKIMPVEDVMEKEDAYYLNMLGIYEMITTGTTTYLDMHMFEGMSAKAARDSKMRAYISRSIVGDDLYSDEGAIRRYKEMLSEKDMYESDLIKFMVMPHAIYTASKNLISQLNDVAKEKNMLKQIHLSETDTEVNDAKEKYNMTPVELLDSINFLDENTQLAHCVKLTDNDFEILKNRNVTVVTNASSNAKLGNGIADVPRMIKEGINVTIGTDGASSNNALNMFREMGILSLIQKGDKKDTLTMDAQTVLKMATINASRALKMENEIGIIKENALADLIMLDLNSPSLFPNNNIIASIVYSANGSEVESVMINGEFVMRDRNILTFNTKEVLDKVNDITKKYLYK